MGFSRNTLSKRWKDAISGKQVSVKRHKRLWEKHWDDIKDHAMGHSTLPAPEEKNMFDHIKLDFGVPVLMPPGEIKYVPSSDHSADAFRYAYEGKFNPHLSEAYLDGLKLDHPKPITATSALMDYNPIMISTKPQIYPTTI